MKEELISGVLETGKQVPRSKLGQLSTESLKMIITLRKGHAK